MSIKSRRILGAATTVVWLAWVIAEYLRVAPHIPTGPVHEVLTIGLRILVLVASLSCVMAWVVGPVLATARIALMTTTHVERHRVPDRAVVGEVVPLRRYRNWVDN